MKIKALLATAFTVISLSAAAQQTEKAILTNAVPVPVADSGAVAKIVSAEKEAAAQAFVKKTSFSLSAGTMFGGYGMASYVAPSLRYQLSPKFSVFGGVTYLNTNFNPAYSEQKMPMASRNYLVHAGGSYQVNDKLRLSGSVWRDFANAGNHFMPGSLNRPARYGTEFQARYKITEHLSVFGSIRTSNGYDPFYYNGPSNFSGPDRQIGF